MYRREVTTAWPGKEIPITDQPHGRYFAQELMLNQDAEAREQIQDALNAGERKEWHFVGVSDVPQTGGTILFWDTARPSFGRTSQLRFAHMPEGQTVGEGDVDLGQENRGYGLMLLVSGALEER